MCGRADDPSMYAEDVPGAEPSDPWQTSGPGVTPWGEVWGAPWVRESDGAVILMRRKAQRVRFFTQDGEPVGPEHRNVVPAMIWAWSSQSGLTDPNGEPWLLKGIRDEIEADRDDPFIDYASGQGY